MTDVLPFTTTGGANGRQHLANVCLLGRLTVALLTLARLTLALLTVALLTAAVLTVA